MKKLALLLAAAMVLTFSACTQASDSASGVISGADNSPVSPAASPASGSDPAPAPNPEIPEPVLDPNPVVLKQFAEPAGPIATMKTSMGDIEIMLFPEEAPKAVENFITHVKAGYYDGLIFHRVINNFMLQGGDPLGNGTGGESIWGAPFQDEFSDSLHNFRGALSMANSGANSNGSQFFIVQNSSATLNDYAFTAYYNLLEHQGYTRIAQMATQVADQEQFSAYVAAEEAAINARLQAGVPEAYAKKLEPVVEKYKEVGGTPHLDNKHTVFGQVTKGMEVVDAIAAVEVTEPGNKDKPKVDVKIISITVTE